MSSGGLRQRKGQPGSDDKQHVPNNSTPIVSSALEKGDAVKLSVCFVLRSSDGKKASASTGERTVKLCVRDDKCFRHEAPTKLNIDCVDKLSLASVVTLANNGGEMCSDPVPLSAQTTKLCLLLYDDDGNFCGRLHVSVNFAEKSLDLSVKLIAQLQLPGSSPDEILSNPLYKRSVLSFTALYLIVGIVFGSLYIGSDVIDSAYFCVNVLMQVGLADIMESPGEHVNETFGHAFLLIYMVIGVVILYSFMDAYFGELVDSACEKIDSLKIKFFQDQDDAKGYLGVGCSRMYLMALTALLIVGTITLMLTEGWNVMKALYYATSVMITVGYTHFGPDTALGKAFIILWMPAASILFFYVQDDYITFRGDTAKAKRQQRLLDKLIKEPEDLQFLADSQGTVSKFAYMRYMLTRLGSIDEEELDAIEESFRRLDKSGDGLVSAADFGGNVAASKEAKEIRSALALHAKCAAEDDED